MNGQSIKDLVESEGMRPVALKLQDLLDKGEVQPSDFSIKEMWEAFCGPVGSTLSYGMGRPGFQGVEPLAEASVGSSAFAGIMGQVLTAEAFTAYTRPGDIGGMLFRTRPSRRKVERKPGFILQDDTAEVDEGMPYPESGMRDRFVSYESGKKRGIILAITEEAVFLDETGVLLDRAMAIGDFIRQDKETRLLNVFTGTTNSYYPEGVATTIYSSGNGNLTTTNALVDWTDINLCMADMAAQTDPNGTLIVVVPRVLVVPFALLATAHRIVNATSIEQGAISATVPVGHVPNPAFLRAITRGGSLDIVTSPLVDSYSATAWYIGDPQRGFLYREHWPFQSFRKRAESEDAFNKDVITKFKFREWGTAHCDDHRFTYKNTA